MLILNRYIGYVHLESLECILAEKKISRRSKNWTGSSPRHYVFALGRKENVEGKGWGWDWVRLHLS